MSGAISVNLAVQRVSTNLENALPPIVSIEEDMESMEKQEMLTGEWPRIDFIPIDIYSEFGKLPYVRNYDISVGAGLLSDELERYVIDEGVTLDMGRWETFRLKGVYNSSLIDVEEGTIELTSGRAFSEQEARSQSYVTLISEEVASINNLHIGSTFTLSNIVWDTRRNAGMDSDFYIEDNIYVQRTHDFEVVGIFRSLAHFDTGDAEKDGMLRDAHINSIYVPNPVALEAQMHQIEHIASLHPEQFTHVELEETLWFQNVYVLNDFQSLNMFKEAVEGHLPDFWKITDLSDSHSSITIAMENMNNLTLLILMLAAGTSVTIASLLIVLMLHERKKEIGVYLSLGETRGKVVAQMMIEIATIILIAMIFSLFAGSLIADSLSESLLRRDMAANVDAEGSMGVSFMDLNSMGFAIEGISAEDAMAAYSVSLDTATALTFFAVATATVLLSTIIPMLYILRLNPRKIMM